MSTEVCLRADVEIVQDCLNAQLSSADSIDVVDVLDADVILLVLFKKDSARAIDELVEKISAEPPAPIVAMLPDDPLVRGLAVECGVTNIVGADVNCDEVVKILRLVASGRPVTEPIHLATWLRAAQQAHNKRTKADLFSNALSPRERQVLDLLASGVGTRRIAGTLNISKQTVNFYVKSLIGKMGVSSRLEVVVEAQALGLVCSGHCCCTLHALT